MAARHLLNFYGLAHPYTQLLPLRLQMNPRSYASSTSLRLRKRSPCDTNRLLCTARMRKRIRSPSDAYPLFRDTRTRRRARREFPAKLLGCNQDGQLEDDYDEKKDFHYLYSFWLWWMKRTFPFKTFDCSNALVGTEARGASVLLGALEHNAQVRTG